MPPVRYTITLTGNGDDAEPSKVQAVYERFVRALRSAGVTANGVLTGHSSDTRDEAGTLVPGTVFHDNANDVEDLPATPRATASKSKKKAGG